MKIFFILYIVLLLHVQKIKSLNCEQIIKDSKSEKDITLTFIDTNTNWLPDFEM